MKRLSIRLKITLWFSLLLAALLALTYAVIFSVSDTVLSKSVQDVLIETVGNNVDEVEFFSTLAQAENDQDNDQYIHYNGGFLEIDDDYLDRLNGVTTALYHENGELLYGSNPIARSTAELSFADAKVQRVSVSGDVWFVYDSRLTLEGLEGLWLRGVVSKASETTQFSSIVNISLFLLPLLLLLAVLGGFLLTGRSLRPLQQMTETATHITRGQDLKQRIVIGEGQDEVHRLADSFNEMLDRLNDSFAAEQQFTADASHELRTPTSVIAAQCEYTLEQERSAEEYREALQVIRRQSGKMTRLIGDMLSFTRLEQKAGSLTDTDLSALVSSVCEDMALLQDKGITLSSELAPDIHIMGSSVLLSRLAVNLISNAYRYGRENGFIRVTLQKSGEQAVLSVEDNGIGIAREDRENIFRRFYQADSSRTGSGTGLGLAMVEQIARLHGGSVEVDSEPAVGSTFRVLFPLP